MSPKLPLLLLWLIASCSRGVPDTQVHSAKQVVSASQNVIGLLPSANGGIMVQTERDARLVDRAGRTVWILGIPPLDEDAYFVQPSFGGRFAAITTGTCLAEVKPDGRIGTKFKARIPKNILVETMYADLLHKWSALGLLVGGDRSVVAISQLSTGSTKTLDVHDDFILRLVGTRDGTQAFGATHSENSDHGSAFAVALRTNSFVWRVDLPYVGAMALDSNERFLCISNPGKLVILQAATGKKLREMPCTALGGIVPPGTTSAIAATTDGRFIVGTLGGLIVVDPETGQSKTILSGANVKVVGVSGKFVYWTPATKRGTVFQGELKLGKG